jgi:PAS domain S-box-containing protein
MGLPILNSLRFKLGAGAFALIAINVLVTAWTIYNFGRLTVALSSILNENYPSIISVENMARSVERHEHAIASLLNGDLNNGKIEFIQAKESFAEAFGEASRNPTVPDAGPIIENIYSTYEGYLLLSDSLLKLASAEQYESARAFYYNTITPFSQRLSANCFWLIEENQKEMIEVSQKTKDITQQAILAVVFGVVFALILSILTVVQFNRRVLQPAERLTETVHNIGRGRLDLKIDIETNDEIGQLGREFNKMTERLRRYEEMNIDQILQEKHKSESIVGNISDAIIVCDGVPSIQMMNRYAEQLLRLREKDVIGKRFGEIKLDDRIARILADPGGARALNQPYLRFEVQGGEVYVRPRLSAIPSRDGSHRGAVLILQDVTQYKELDREKSRFMAMVSHEFRTPLTSINMGVDILRRNLLGPLTPAQEELLASFKDDCERLTKLVRDLLQLSKLESGRMEHRNDLVDMHKLINESVHILQLQFREKGIIIRVDVPASLPPIFGDEQHLSWVVSNLLNNALRHTDRGGSVTVTAEEEGGAIVIHVRDTGHGIPPEFMEKIFDKFVQVKNTPGSTPGSVGLGLAIAKDIVEMHGGTIWVESEVEKGSIFSFRLPSQHLAHA